MRLKISFLGTAMLALLMTACSENSKQEPMSNQNSEGVTPIENIMSRASVRRFTDKEISKETMDTVLRAAMAAPSAVNKQPWEFIVVTDRAVLDRLMEAHPYSNLKTAKAAVIVCGNMKRALEGVEREYWVQDCSAASENLLLAAHAVGLGAVWCGVYPMQERIDAIKGVLDIPEYITPLNVIAMGYPAVEPSPKDKWEASKVHYQKW